MSLTFSTPSSLGESAPAFTLPGVDGKLHQLGDFLNAEAIVVFFMCNHCPYVIAVQDRINDLVKQFASRNVRFIGINSNDSRQYPADNFEAMQIRAKEQNFAFPYLWDESQETAKNYGAVCTPEFFLYKVSQGATSLAYKGRLDDYWKDESKVRCQDLRLAIGEVLAGNDPPSDPKPAMGCSIKWK